MTITCYMNSFNAPLALFLQIYSTGETGAAPFFQKFAPSLCLLMTLLSCPSQQNRAIRSPNVRGPGFRFFFKFVPHLYSMWSYCQLKQIRIYTILPCSLPLCYKLLPLAGAQTCRRWHFVSQRNPNIPGETPTLNPFNCCILFPSQSFSFFTPQTWIRPFLYNKMLNFQCRFLSNYTCHIPGSENLKRNRPNPGA